MFQNEPPYHATPLAGVETNRVQFTPWSVVSSPPPLVFLRQTSTPEALERSHKDRRWPEKCPEHRRLSYSRFRLRLRPQSPDVVS
eukprot:3887997-Pyramimonas_sp.AAC.1